MGREWNKYFSLMNINERIPGFKLECKEWLANCIYFFNASGVANVDEIYKTIHLLLISLTRNFGKRLKSNPYIVHSI